MLTRYQQVSFHKVSYEKTNQSFDNADRSRLQPGQPDSNKNNNNNDVNNNLS